MKLLHIMLSRGLGGIEQVFLDYTAMLRAEGVEVLPVIHPNAATRKHTPDALLLPNWGKWDFTAIWRLQKIIKNYQPDYIITHGNRALSFARHIKDTAKLYPVAHNYWLKGFRGLPNAIAITEDVAKTLRGLGIQNISVIPNIVQSADILSTPRAMHKPPVIGTMGRMVHKKGFDVFLRALAELKAGGIAFNAVIGGSGEEESALKKLCADLKLGQEVKFIGWVNDKAKFFAALDVFCLPSRSEPFGIVLLEAFAHGVPVVSTRNEGASQIATHENNALLCDENELAEGLQKTLQQSELYQSLRANAFATAKQYHPSIIGKRLKAALTSSL